MQESLSKMTRIELIILLAMMTSIIAMSIDMILPVLETIGEDFNLTNNNDTQYLISAFIFGFSFGQIIAGPLSDQFGRKPVIIGGYVIFVIGCLLSMLANSWELMLLGRVIQGFGAASPRIVTTALIRDLFSGREMAKVMSFIMAFFILVPAVAPAIGFVVAGLSGWQGIFFVFAFLSVLISVWFFFRQPETLLFEKRRKVSFSEMKNGVGHIFKSPIAMGYTIATGLIFGAFLAYLGMAQQIFERTYDAGPLFVVYFAISALFVGAASILNSFLVMRLGMKPLIWWANLAIIGLSLVFLVPTFANQGYPPFWQYLVWLFSVFFFVGILFGNLNAAAMEPLGKAAGLGAAFIGAASNFISLPFAWFIGNQFDGSITPLVLGFAILSCLTICPLLWANDWKLVKSSS